MGSEWRAESSADLTASPAEVYALIADFTSWKEWAVGPEGTTSCAWSTGGAPRAAGAWLAWEGDACGRGRLVLVEGSPEHGVRIEERLDGDDDARHGSAEFMLVATASGTRVVWRQEGSSGAIAGAWLRGIMEERVKHEMDASLSRLASLLKARSPKAEERL